MYIWYHQQTRAVEHISEPPFTDAPPAGYAITEIPDVPYPGDTRWLRLTADLRALELDPTRAPSAEAVAMEEFRRTRAAAYPPIGDQLDALWKGGAEADAMKAMVMAVKAMYPKPSP